MENSVNPPSEPRYEAPNLSSGDPQPDPPSDPPYDSSLENDLDPHPFNRILTHSRASTTSRPEARKDKENNTKRMDGSSDVSSLVDTTTLDRDLIGDPTVGQSNLPSQSYAATPTLPPACSSSPTPALDPTFPLGTPHPKKTPTSRPPKRPYHFLPTWPGGVGAFEDLNDNN